MSRPLATNPEFFWLLSIVSTACVWRSEKNLKNWFLPSGKWVQGIELRFSDLAANTFTIEPSCKPAALGSVLEDVKQGKGKNAGVQKRLFICA